MPPASRLIQQSVALRHATLVLLFGALTALSAQIHWYLPGNPVPVTAQVFAVLLAGSMLGSKLGAMSQIVYVGFGMLGAPVFAGGLSGPVAMLGPTGGYLIGFVIAAAVVGAAGTSPSRPSMLTAVMVAGVAVIYLCGAGGLAVWTHFAHGMPWAQAATTAVAQGIVPFLLADGIKVALAVAFTHGMLRREDR
jgi:biotin transport system substrate-specific component